MLQTATFSVFGLLYKLKNSAQRSKATKGYQVGLNLNVYIITRNIRIGSGKSF